MVPINRFRPSPRPYRHRSASLQAWLTGLEVAVFVAISGGSGAALLWFVAQDEVSFFLRPPMTSSPALSRPASVPAADRVCVDWGEEATTQACLRL